MKVTDRERLLELLYQLYNETADEAGSNEGRNLHDRSGNLLPLLENAYTDSVREEDRDETVWREAKRLCAGTGTFQTTDPDKANDVYQAVEELGYDCDCTRTRHAPLSLPGTTTYNRGCEVFTLRAI